MFVAVRINGRIWRKAVIEAMAAHDPRGTFERN
jgi:hypothetical protein